MRQTELDRATDDLARRERLAAPGAVSGEELQHARGAFNSRAGGLARRAAAARSQSRAHRSHDGREPSRRARTPPRKCARPICDYARTALPAPVAGFVAKRAVQLGQRVSPGAPLMAIVPLDQVWVDANFKEPQLAAMRVGQPVKLTADLYGGKVVYHGTGRRLRRRHRLGLRAAAGAERHRQLDQDRAARTGARRARPAGARRASAADRPVDAGRSRHAQRAGDRLPQLAQTAPAYATDVFGSLGRRRRRARQGDHRRQRRWRDRHAWRQRAGARAQTRRDRRSGARPDGTRTAAATSRTTRAVRHTRRRAPGHGQPQRPKRTRRCAAAPPPLKGGALALGTVALVARDVHERARHVDRQRVDPRDRGRSRRVARSGHVGHHVVRRRQCDLAAVDRLADATLRTGATVHRFGAAVRHRIVPVRTGALDRAADRVPRDPGRGCRADDSAVAVAAPCRATRRNARARHWRCGRSRRWWLPSSDRCSADGSPTTSPGRGSSTSTSRSASPPPP